jgi:hypothetical protein
MMSVAAMEKRKRAYWVVSPNVRYSARSVSAWRQASVEFGAAFMGWSPDNPEHSRIGPKFAGNAPGGIEPGDVILIARRSGGVPEIVGFGVVQGEVATTLPGFTAPEEFGSLRRLRPFLPWSRPPPNEVPLKAAVRHIRALAQLHPDTDEAHREVCQWMERRLKKHLSAGAGEGGASNGRHSSRADDAPSGEVAIVSSTHNYQLDYTLRSKEQVRQAQKVEARLLDSYKKWLEVQERRLDSVKYGGLQCDGYEEARQNLVEAKSSASREHIRMAVGQLLDYAFQGREKLGDPNKALLLPTKPPHDVERWLEAVGIKLIWPVHGAFLDNANGQFT